MRFLRQVFIKGLIAVLPVALTIYLIVWLAQSLEALMGGLIRVAVPTDAYLPGMGLIAGFALVLGVGLLLQTWLAQRAWSLGERLLDRMPLVRAVFGAFKQIVGYLGSADEPAGRRAVLVSLTDGGARMLGLVTQEDLDFLGSGHDAEIAVFLPWSYQVGGFTIFVPTASVERIDLPAQEALRLALTAAVGDSAGRR